MKENKFNWNYLISISFVSAMGGLLFGYDWVVIGGAKPFYEPFFGITNNPFLQGWAMSSALIGCLAGTVISGWLSYRFGRKKLLILSAGLFSLASLGAGGLAGIFVIIGAMYFFHIQGLPLLIMVVSAIACYAMSIAPLTWVVLSEIFPNQIRGVAMSIATFALWAACFILTYTFPLLNKLLNASGTFWLYGLICIIGFWFIFKRLSETKGKSLEEIENVIFK